MCFISIFFIVFWSLGTIFPFLVHYVFWWPWYSCILSFLLRTWDRLQIICQYEKYLEQLLNGFIIAHQIWPTSEDHCWNYRVITHHILLDLFFVWCYSICSVSICFFGVFYWKNCYGIMNIGHWTGSESSSTFFRIFFWFQSYYHREMIYKFHFQFFSIYDISFCQNNKMKWKILHFPTKKWAHTTLFVCWWWLHLNFALLIHICATIKWCWKN